MSELIFAVSLLIIVNLVGLFFFRWVRKNKYKVGDYVYKKSDNGRLELAEIVYVDWYMRYDDIVDRPTYGITFIEGEHKGFGRDEVPESAIFCKFKGERLIFNE